MALQDDAAAGKNHLSHVACAGVYHVDADTMDKEIEGIVREKKDIFEEAWDAYFGSCSGG